MTISSALDRFSPPRFGTIMLVALLAMTRHVPAAEPAPVADAPTSNGPAPSVIATSATYPGVYRSAIGVTQQGTRIDLFLQDDDLDVQTTKMRLLMIGGVDGKQSSVDAALATLRWFHDEHATHQFRDRFTLSAIPCVNPAPLSPGNIEPQYPDLTSGYPPTGNAYHAEGQPDEAAYLWRWLGMHAPDVVIDLRIATETTWQVPESWAAQFGNEVLSSATTVDTKGDLIVELARHKVCQTGAIQAVRLTSPPDEVNLHLKALLSGLATTKHPRRSAARLELQRRLERSPKTVARQLAEHYGHDLQQVVYIPAIALIGRLRWGQFSGDPTHQADVTRIVRPYFDGDKSSTPTSGSGLSGHLVFSELAASSEGEARARYVELARQAADHAFDEDGAIKPIMPFHHEMSDAAFMGGPILASVGHLTGDDRYFRACARHLNSVRSLVLRDDGLYRHSPLDEAAWGRGNGFPALGLAMCLAEFPHDHPERPNLLAHFQRHLRTLVKHQDPTGCWHQVIDRPESFRELSSTCMITYAMARGIRENWLPRDEFQPIVDLAWGAILSRVAEDGQLVDVCTGTGKQRSLRDYYDRPAILGRDPRGGAMALLVATEIAAQ